MTWNERKFVNDVLAQNVKDVLAQNVNDVMLDRACAPYGFFYSFRKFSGKFQPTAADRLLGMQPLPFLSEYYLF